MGTFVFKYSGAPLVEDHGCEDDTHRGVGVHQASFTTNSTCGVSSGDSNSADSNSADSNSADSKSVDNDSIDSNSGDSNSVNSNKTSSSSTDEIVASWLVKTPD